MKHTVGQCDLTPASIGAWSFDEGRGDTGLANFSLQQPGNVLQNARHCEYGVTQEGRARGLFLHDDGNLILAGSSSQVLQDDRKGERRPPYRRKRRPQ